MDESEKKYFRRQLAKHIEGGEAFMPLSNIINKVPYDQLGVIPKGLPYSLWQQFYHIRFAQFDLLDFSRNPQYKQPKWPDDYWPKATAPSSPQEWEETVSLFFQERKEFIKLVLDPGLDLYKPLPHGNGQTLFREALLALEHNAYHTGQLLIILRLLGLHSS